MTYSFRPTFVSILLALVIMSALLNLGVWQLNRAEVKQLWKTEFAMRSNTVIDITLLNDPSKDLRFYRITLTGQYDNEHSLLLDNKIVNHQIGYELITPFYIFGDDRMILVNRGFIPQGKSRNQLPSIDPMFGEQTITGILTAADNGTVSLAADVFQGSFPWRIQKVDLNVLNKALNQNFYNYMLTINEKTVPITNMQPEKHIAYAVQWFALALTFLVLFILLNVKRK